MSLPAEVVLASLLVSALVGLGAPVHAAAQWRDTEVPPARVTPLVDPATPDGAVRLPEPLWMHRVRAFRRFGGVLVGIGGALIIASEVAFARGTFDAVFATDLLGTGIGAAGLFTMVGAQVRRRRVRIHLGLRAPMPEHRGRRRRIGGGVLLGLAGVVAGGTILALSSDSGCGDSSECEGTVLTVLIPALLGSHLTVSGVALLASGAAHRRGARGRVRISVGADRGVPTLVAQF